MIKLLLIEDDQLIQRMYMRLFELEGFQFSIAANGQDGLAAVKSIRPDFILLDLKMPVMNGLDVLAHLKADQSMSTIPVIVLTNSYNSEDIKAAMDGGADLVLIKSQTSPSNVVNQVKLVLQKRTHQPPTETKPPSPIDLQ